MTMTTTKDVMTENEQLEYNDAVVGFASIMQQHGVNKVLMDFQTNFPAFFKEMQSNLPKFPAKPVAALLRK
jgi:hypothetical protein